ncbi:hypothetical protein [Kribbella antibiotica]|uniref:hypothetical protein n=1 Tax=Kribbella antibiotica TaxID=190195 RepID=UPI00192DED00|nr:hypothetical protein [Kribbella antibiotica]
MYPVVVADAWRRGIVEGVKGSDSEGFDGDQAGYFVSGAQRVSLVSGPVVGWLETARARKTKLMTPSVMF